MLPISPWNGPAREAGSAKKEYLMYTLYSFGISFLHGQFVFRKLQRASKTGIIVFSLSEQLSQITRCFIHLKREQGAGWQANKQREGWQAIKQASKETSKQASK